MPLPTNAVLPSALQNLLASRWLHPLNDLGALDELLREVHPTWSLTRTRALVVADARETPDVRTLVLQPNYLWPGHRAGQHVLVEVDLDGRRIRRTFTIASAPRSDGRLAITVKRRVGGRLSVWWNDRARVGDVVTLSAPMGDFVLPTPIPSRLTLLSAGSGITPAMALLRELEQRAPRTQIRFVHSARTQDEVIFANELKELTTRLPNFELRLHLSARQGRLDDATLLRLAHETGDDLAYVCGPAAFMEVARKAWQAAGCQPQLRFEYFASPPSLDAEADDTVHTVHADRSKVSFSAGSRTSLLVAAEAAGLSPAFGCRVGICHTCKCRKLSGVVEDLRTGRQSAEPDEMIQMCVSTARSAVTLAL